MRTKGFTLIETLVAVSILFFAVLGPLTLASKGISASGFASNQVTAFYLAQEGIELVRNIRDNNFLDSGRTWNEGFDNCSGGTGCSIYPLTGLLTPGRATLRENTSTGLYEDTVTNGNPAGPEFEREIHIDDAGNDGNEVSVRVTISWMNGRIAKSFTVQENLFNWRGK